MSESAIIVEGLGKKCRIQHPPAPLPALSASRRQGGAESGAQWTVYAIQNLAGGVYIGQTGDLPARLTTRNGGDVRSTRSDAPWTRIAEQTSATQPEARWLARRLKRSLGKRLGWLKLHRLPHDEP